MGTNYGAKLWDYCGGPVCVWALMHYTNTAEYSMSYVICHMTYGIGCLGV
jgi:hypothetical protein